MILDFSNVFMNYMDIWAPKTGDSDLEVTPEGKTSTISVRQQFTMTRVVGHAPKNLSKQFYQFLSLPSCSISCEVTGK